MMPLFFFGAMSPYSWFAAERIGELLPQARWRGVFAGALFKANGRVSWGLTERREQGIADCRARAAAHGLGPIHWPDPWPTSDLLIARAIAYAGRCEGGGQGVLRPFALAAMRLAFLEGADLAELDVVLEAGRRCNIDADGLRDALAHPSVKHALRDTTDQALALGVFGVPTIVVGKELFWGDDRLEQAAGAYASASA
ncbi:MAG TPA: DsbA family protein [Solirubrobacteraceae bacterium]|nr:DsbA family protein [Solirubrobacteraceae bacterium]